MQQMTSEMPEKKMMEEGEEEMSPLDSIIERVRSYKENPKMVTPETLGELESELMDLKGYVDGEGEREGGDMKHKGLTVILGGMGK